MRDIDKRRRFDTARTPVRQSRILQWVVRFVGRFQIRSHKTQIKYIGTEGIRPPYLLLCNHNSFFDFFLAFKTVAPERANYVVAIDGYIIRIGPFILNFKFLMRPLGCICKRKFTNDISLVRNLKQVIDNGDVAVMYPEARYSLCGTSAVLPESLGKVCKMLDVPVVTLMCHGHHVNSPFWRLGDQKVPTEAEFSLLLSREQLHQMSVEEINAALKERFSYDDFKWQRDKGIEIKDPNRAKGLHKVLYQCPHCGKEHRMTSRGKFLRCENCGKMWELTTLGELRALKGETEFTHIPNWYEWERANVRKEIEQDRYSLLCPVHVRSLPNTRFIPIGSGFLRHDKNGFHVEVDGKFGHKEMDKTVQSSYSCHVEFEYLRKFGDALDLSTLTDTWFIYGESPDFCLTKIALAVEELFDFYNPRKRIAIKA